MFGYPLFLDLSGEQCLVFGGGEVALRKIQALLKRGARVTCVSKDFCKSLKKLSHISPLVLPSPPQGGRGLKVRGGVPNGTLHLKRIHGNRMFLNGARIVIAATSNRDFNARVAGACRKKKIWVNVVDDPELCDFYVPAVVERGPLQIAISTGGASPLFAKRLREELEKVIPVSTGNLLERIGRIRKGTKKR